MSHPSLPQIRTCGLPHPAPRVTGLLRSGQARNVYRAREREARFEMREARPRHAGLVGAAVKPLPPKPTDLVSKAVQRRRVPGDAVVVVVSAELSNELLMLPGHPLMTNLPKPLGGPLQRAAEATARRLPSHHPEASPRACPEVGERQEVETSFAGVPGLILPDHRWWPKIEQAGLGRVKSQSVLTETFRQHVHHLARLL